ncbi:hypothetical protein TGDOM2_297100 [Toxoplasma gondii GAB2-2007-GAL-DOM2]|uniref:Uncharacterized protein n=9 Tax=Toxoplasma gondii TaxID=5811 RepID=B9QHK3_TOXGV|nr:hypothetical protein TGVEG_297100 [Toxoplasma gondii VEG]KFG29832.1 hypothetical protein TGP89_297100 [Toxoplasma gondii p89]KFG41837.1 hypothetical protein TGDOM2_297100 [Toxoplasma gondii GAB2-2007-GAL-DOM2]RQX67464.1 hypothetical protein TGCAST_297100 [Toxoplasma gondii CAST]CEL72009.1 TPA: hypothetical protein BN1205_053920 [Toxoplasma gondii VEG]
MGAVSPPTVRGFLLSSVANFLSVTPLSGVPKTVSIRHVAAVQARGTRASSRPYHTFRRNAMTPPQSNQICCARVLPCFYRSFSSSSSSGPEEASSSPKASSASSLPRLLDSELTAIFQGAAAGPRAATGKDKSQKRKITVSSNRLFKALLQSGILDRDLTGSSAQNSPRPVVEFQKLCDLYEEGRFYRTWAGGAHILKISGVKGLAPPGGNLKGGIIDGTPKHMSYEEFRTFVHAVRVWLRDERSPVPLCDATVRATGSSRMPAHVLD